MTGGASGNGVHVCMCARDFHALRAPRPVAVSATHLRSTSEVKAGAALTGRPSLTVPA